MNVVDCHEFMARYEALTPDTMDLLPPFLDKQLKIIVGEITQFLKANPEKDVVLIVKKFDHIVRHVGETIPCKFAVMFASYFEHPSEIMDLDSI